MLLPDIYTPWYNSYRAPQEKKKGNEYGNEMSGHQQNNFIPHIYFQTTAAVLLLPLDSIPSIKTKVNSAKCPRSIFAEEAEERGIHRIRITQLMRRDSRAYYIRNCPTVVPSKSLASCYFHWADPHADEILVHQIPSRDCRCLSFRLSALGPDVSPSLQGRIQICMDNFWGKSIIRTPVGSNQRSVQ